MRIAMGVVMILGGTAALVFAGWVRTSENCQQSESCQETLQLLRDAPIVATFLVAMFFMLIYFGVKLAWPGLLQRKSD